MQQALKRIITTDWNGLLTVLYGNIIKTYVIKDTDIKDMQSHE